MEHQSTEPELVNRHLLNTSLSHKRNSAPAVDPGHLSKSIHQAPDHHNHIHQYQQQQQNQQPHTLHLTKQNSASSSRLPQSTHKLKQRNDSTSSSPDSLSIKPVSNSTNNIAEKIKLPNSKLVISDSIRHHKSNNSKLIIRRPTEDASIQSNHHSNPWYGELTQTANSSAVEIYSQIDIDDTDHYENIDELTTNTTTTTTAFTTSQDEDITKSTMDKLG